MTAQRRRPGAGALTPGSGGVVSLAARAAARIGYKRLASGQVASVRARLGMTRAEFAEHLTAELGWPVTPEAVGYWESEDAPPGDVLRACDQAAGEIPGGVVSLLDAVPGGFPAAALAGPWVTAYEFTHAGRPMVHADIAVITAESGRRVRAVNHPPEPRTEGRAVPFRNEIEAQLSGRHLTGLWRNLSDARYFGMIHLAVLPGETVMEGLYTGLASDISVSSGPWRWVRLDPGDAALDGFALRDPRAVYDIVNTRTPTDAPLTASDIREDA